MKKTLILYLVLSFCGNSFAQSKMIDSLQQIVSANKQDTVQLNALLSLVYEFSRNNIPKAKAYTYQGVALAKSIRHPSKLAANYLYLVTIYQNEGVPDSSRLYLGLLEALSKDNPDNRKVEIVYNQAAGLYHKNNGDFKKALPFMLRNVELLPTENEGRAGHFLNLGNLYNNLGDFKNAVNYHLKALTLFEKLGNERGQSFCLQSLGNDFFELSQFDQAKQYFARSYDLKEKLKDKRGLISASNGLADVYLENKEYAAAEKYYKKSLQSSQEMKLLAEEARTAHKLGTLYKEMGDVEQAKQMTSYALKLARQAGDSLLSVKISSSLTMLQSTDKKEKGTETILLNNLKALKLSGNKMGEAIEYARLSEYYTSQNKFDKALEYYKIHQQLKDSLEGSTVLVDMRALEAQYNDEKKEREIILLKKDKEVQALTLSRQRANNIIITITLISVVIFGALLINRYRILNRAKREIEIEKVRNSIARDLHDDIGSTLSSINIMSQVALQDNDKAAMHLQKIASHSSRMMESMSDIVWSINPKNDSLEQVVAKMKEFAAEILEPKDIDYYFHIATEIHDLKLDVAKRKNIFLIFKEAINNAAKYSEGKKVNVTLDRIENTFQLMVRDNGKGFDTTLNNTGNGLKNMEARANTMGGVLEQKSTVGSGTEILLKLPLT